MSQEARLERALVFSRTGTALGEVRATVARTWHVERISQATISIPTGDAKFTPELFRPRNIFYVEAQNLEAWAGFLWMPLRWREGIFSGTLWGTEKLLGFRRTGSNAILSGNGGTIFGALINYANLSESLGITVGSVEPGGGNIERTYNLANVLEAVDKLASDLDKEWWIAPAVSGGKLTLAANWGTRGGTFGKLLVEGRNFTNVELSEEGDVANDIIAYGKFEEWTSPLLSQAADATSRTEYGLIEDTVAALDTDDQITLDNLVAAHLGRRKARRMVMTGDVLGPPYPRCGDLATVMLSRTMWISGKIGGKATMRVQATGFDPVDGVMTVALREV